MSAGAIVGVIIALVVVGLVACIPGFLGMSLCNSFGAGYTGCLSGTRCACRLYDDDGSGTRKFKKCLVTTVKGCDGFGSDSVHASWHGDATTGACTESTCEAAAAAFGRG
jgi:hypothetical protein